MECHLIHRLETSCQKVPRSISASVCVAVEPFAVWNMMGSQVRFFKFILSAFPCGDQVMSASRVKDELRSLACTGSECT